MCYVVVVVALESPTSTKLRLRKHTFWYGMCRKSLSSGLNSPLEGDEELRLVMFVMIKCLNVCLKSKKKSVIIIYYYFASPLRNETCQNPVFGYLI